MLKMTCQYDACNGQECAGGFQIFHPSLVIFIAQIVPFLYVSALLYHKDLFCVFCFLCIIGLLFLIATPAKGRSST